MPAGSSATQRATQRATSAGAPPTRRRRAGRPPVLDEQAERVCLYVPVSAVRVLRRVGDGNLSAGLRKLTIMYELMPDALRTQLLASDTVQEPHGEDNPGNTASSDPWD